ncbi:MAG: tRNA (adenosine(37)-N6)-dimethylallyltransferase MiaA, partial [Chthoniobacterales bacterium]
SQILHIAGPTGVGKSALAVDLAERLDAEIIGADAFQIYAGLPILTAQPGPEALQRVPHHLVGCVPVEESFDAQRYATAARGAMDGILARGRRVIVAGGTGLYFRALIDGLAPTPAADAALRAELEEMPLDALVERLRRADPAAPGQVDLRNKRRVSRAIEILEISGRPLADFRATPRTDACGLLLVREREDMWRRIEASVRAMFDNGVVEEVRAIGDRAGPTASRAIGFREIQALLRGELTRAQCEAAMIVTTRQYAKRQLTWFRGQTTFRALDLTGMHKPAVEDALVVLDLQ